MVVECSTQTGKFLVSDDAKTWTQIWEGCDFPADKAKNQFVLFYTTEVFFKSVTTRYFKFTFTNRNKPLARLSYSSTNKLSLEKSSSYLFLKYGIHINSRGQVIHTTK